MLVKRDKIKPPQPPSRAERQACSPGTTGARSLYLRSRAKSDIGASFLRVTLGFLLVALVGVPLGILKGSLKAAEAFFEPLLAFFRYMPASAFIPLTIIWLGIFETQKVGVVFIGIFFQLSASSKARLIIPLVRPRSFEVKSSRVFLEIKMRLLEQIREESLKAASMLPDGYSC